MPIALRVFWLSYFCLTASANAIINISTCGVLNQAGETYVLTNDVSSDNGCFLINAGNITLDLNGKTVRYATNPSVISTGGELQLGCMTYAGRQVGTVCHHGISDKQGYANGDPGGTPDWYALPDGGCQNVIIKNGRIEQADAGTTYSENIRLACNGAKILNVTGLVRGRDNLNVLLNGSGIEMANNTFTSEVRQLSNRHSLPGQVKVNVSNSDIHHNSLLGSPHRGIDASGSSNSSFHDNYIRQNAAYTNNHGIGLYNGSAVEIYNNTIEPLDGRGISCEHVNGCHIHHNNISVIETPHAEYGTNYGFSCAHGIKLEGNTTNASVHDNTVTSRTGPGTWGACPLNLGLNSGSVASIHSNLFVAEYGPNSENAAWAASLVFYGNLAGIDVYDNELRSNHYFFYGDSESAGTHGPLIRDSVLLLTTPAPGKTPHAVHIYSYARDNLNTIFRNLSGADLADVHIQDQYVLNWNYYVDYTLTVRVLDNGQPSAGANVSITPAYGSQLQGSTNTEGEFVAQARSYEMYGYSNSSKNRRDYTPHQVTATKNGKSAQTSLLVNSKQTVILNLSNDGADLSAPAAPGNLNVN